MPVIEIRALPQKPGVDRAAAMSRACEALASAAGVRPRAVWATWTELDPALYVEFDARAAVQPDTTHPPIVEIVAFEGRSAETIEAMIVAVATTLASGLQIPQENLFITYREAARGRLWTNGLRR
jgi:hypothetical protein